MPHPRTPTTHRHAHMCTHMQVHKHVALDRKHMRHLCPSVFSPVTRHLFHLPTHAAGSPQGFLANVHHPIELLRPQPSSIPTPSPSLYLYHSACINISVRAPLDARNRDPLKQVQQQSVWGSRKVGTSYCEETKISWCSQESCHSGTWDRKWGSCNFWLSFQRPTFSLLVSLLLSAYLFHSSLSLDLLPPNFCSGMVPHIWSSSKSVLQPLGTILDDGSDSRLPNTIFTRGESDCSSSSSSARPQESCIGH